MIRINLWFSISVGFHVGFGCKPKPHATFKALLQATAHGERTLNRGCVNGVLFCWLPCWFLAFRVWGRSPWERYRGGPCWGPCWFPAFRVWGRLWWERYRGGPCWTVGVHVGFQLSGYGGGHHGKGIAFRVWGRSSWERYRGGLCWVPCWFPSFRVWAWGRSSWERYRGGPCWGPCWVRFQGMGEVTMGKVPWRGSMQGLCYIVGSHSFLEKSAKLLVLDILYLYNSILLFKISNLHWSIYSNLEIHISKSKNHIYIYICF